MVPVKDIRDIEATKHAFHAVFQSPDPFGEPFGPASEARRIIELRPDVFLSAQQLLAISRSARALGDEVAYYSLIEEYQVKPFDSCQHWRIQVDPFPIREVAHGSLLPFGFDVALYSARGLWGVLVSHAEHAVIGGTRPFLEHLEPYLPDDSATVRSLLERWRSWNVKRGVDIAWVPALLANAYGMQRAKELFAGSGIERK